MAKKRQGRHLDPQRIFYSVNHSPLPWQKSFFERANRLEGVTQVNGGESAILNHLRVSYTLGMSKDVSFQLDPSGGEEILRRMAAPTIKRSADAIANRARSMASSLTSNPPEITVTNEIGIIRRGIRSIATVKAQASTPRERYIARMALAKSKDAGRVS